MLSGETRFTRVRQIIETGSKYGRIPNMIRLEL